MRGKRRCRYHGGKSTGRPPTTYLYARHLPPEVLEAFEAADVGSLEAEVRLAKARLDQVLATAEDDPLGGVPKRWTRRDNDGNAVVEQSVRPWVDIIREHLDIIRKLVETNSKLTGTPPLDDDLEVYEQWLKEHSSAK